MHVMRLRNPWELAEGSHGTQLNVRRRFGRPTNLEPRERVVIVFENLAGECTLALNGNPLGRGDRGETCRFDITEQLAARNEILVTASLAGTARGLKETPSSSGRLDFIGTLVTDVRLEIHETGA